MIIPDRRLTVPFVVAISFAFCVEIELLERLTTLSIFWLSECLTEAGSHGRASCRDMTAAMTQVLLLRLRHELRDKGNEFIKRLDAAGRLGRQFILPRAGTWPGW